MSMWRSIILAVALAGLAAIVPAEAQTQRPSPAMFKSGDCKSDECARGRWLDFLKGHGLSELSAAPGVQMRLIVLNAQPCLGKKDELEVRRYVLGRPASEEVSLCGVKSSKTLPPARAAAFAAELAKPEVDHANGDYPIYCSFAEEGPVESHLLEIVQGDRYRLITWDCEAPSELKPLAGLFEDERAALP
jgi:hypothetical protein